MRAVSIVVGLVALVAGCGPETPRQDAAMAASPKAAPRAEPRPSLANCPAVRPIDEPEMLQRKTAIPLPSALTGLMVSDKERFGVAARDGNPICIDASWWEEIANAKVSQDQRFIQFDWMGYESFGHLLIDRTGDGTVVETGISPLAPPTGRRFAAVDLSESAFGALNAFAVWQIEPVGIRQLAKFDQDMPQGDWSVDGWQGDGCVNLSVVPIDRQPGFAPDLAKAPRDPWFAAEAKGWKPEPGRCPG